MTGPDIWRARVVELDAEYRKRQEQPATAPESPPETRRQRRAYGPGLAGSCENGAEAGRQR